MRISDLKRAYYATHPEGLWFKNGGRKNDKWFPTRSVYGGKYFLEAEVETQTEWYDHGRHRAVAGFRRVTTFTVWRIAIDRPMHFERVQTFFNLKDARDHARKLAKGDK